MKTSEMRHRRGFPWGKSPSQKLWFSSVLRQVITFLLFRFFHSSIPILKFAKGLHTHCWLPLKFIHSVDQRKNHLNFRDKRKLSRTAAKCVDFTDRKLSTCARKYSSDKYIMDWTKAEFLHRLHSSCVTKRIHWSPRKYRYYTFWRFLCVNLIPFDGRWAWQPFHTLPVNSLETVSILFGPFLRTRFTLLI